MKYLTSWKKLSTQKPNKNFEIALIAESIEIRGIGFNSEHIL
jgi:hypothetical protein